MKTLSIFPLAIAGLLGFSDELVESVDCNNYAADQMAVVEKHFGCLDADTYNEGFDEMYLWCELINWE